MVDFSGSDNADCFRVQDTHGIVLLQKHRVIASSERLGWQTIFAAEQHESAFDAKFDAVDDHMLVLPLAGSAAMRWEVGDECVVGRATPGRVTMIPGGRELAVRLDGTLETVHIYIRRALVDAAAQELTSGSSNFELRPVFDVPDLLLEQMALAMRDAMLEDDVGTKLYVDRLAWATAAHLVRTQSARAVRIDLSSGLSRRQLSRVMDFIEAKLDQIITISELASVASLSPVYFARRFRQVTGQTPHQYLVNRRIHRAKRLLAATEKSIAEIAFECGFCHQEHLTRTFRRQMDTTPAAYRKSLSK
jgi:AraC family transcriptional regulator